MAALEEYRRDLKNLIEQSVPEDIHNFDETGLFYRMKPSQTSVTKSMRGKKKDKTRISIGLCYYMDGSSKLEPIIMPIRKLNDKWSVMWLAEKDQLTNVWTINFIANW